jgi:hypothetical protein
MPIRHVVRPLALAAALALPAARVAAQEPARRDTAFQPRTVGEAASNTANESKRVYKRGEKATRKAAKDTQKQLKRTGRHLARTVSPAERERQEAEKRAQRRNP